MNTFVFIRDNFARYVLPELSNDAVADSKRALTMNHRLVSGSASRLTGWAMIQQGKAWVQAKLAAEHPSLVTCDPRTRYNAWFEALESFSGPVCFIEFTQSTMNISNIFLTYDPRIVRICGPSSFETFNYLAEPAGTAGKAEKVIAKLRKKHAV